MQKNVAPLFGLSAFLLVLNLSPLHPWPLGWFAFVPLFIVCHNTHLSFKNFISLIYLLGTVFYAYGLFGLINFDLGAYLIALFGTLPAFPIYFGLYRFVSQKIKSPYGKILLAPVLWLILATVYSLTPFGTLGLEPLFLGPSAFLQIASIPPGFQTHAALVVCLCASLALGIQGIHKNQGRQMTLLFLALLLLSWGWGQSRLAHNSSSINPSVGKIKVALIQHNLNPDALWHVQNQELILQTYQKSAEEAAQSGAKLIVFPSYDVYYDELRDPLFFQDLAQKTNAHLLVATYIPVNQNESFRDMAILFAPDGKILDTYQASQPPPFRLIPEERAPDYKILTTPFGKIGMLLCYEDAVPRLAKKAVALGAKILIATSNPGFFNRSPIPYYHLMQDRLRAIETGKKVWRISPNGYSAVIDSRGNILQQTRLDEAKILYTDL